MNLKEKILIKRLFIEILGTIVGAFIMAVSVSLFLLPNKLSSGGISGVATIIYYLFNIPMGISIIIINIPLFLMSILKIGKNFFVKSLIGTVSLSVFIDELDKIPPATTDKFLACIYGGILMGVGTAIILKAHSSTGGTDLISYIAKAYKPTIKFGEIIIILDIAIVTLNIICLKELEFGLYSTIAICWKIAMQESVPAYIIFSNATLEDMARKAPTTLEAFAKVNGVGSVKVKRFGEVFVDAIADYLQEHGG